MLKDCVNVVTLNNPPYTPIPFSSALVNKLFKAKKLAKSKPVITILENNIDLSRLKVTAFETNKEINKEINIKFASDTIIFFFYFFFSILKGYLLLEEACSLEPSTSEMLLVVPAVIKIFIKNKNNLFTGAAVGVIT